MKSTLPALAAVVVPGPSVSTAAPANPQPCMPDRVTRAMNRILLVIILPGLITLSATSAPMNLNTVPPESPIAFGLNEIRLALAEDSIDQTPAATVAAAGQPGIIVETLAAFQAEGITKTDDLPAEASATEGFAILTEQGPARNQVWVIGGDEGGAMYGALELAEQIRQRGLDGLIPIARAPAMGDRGVKFNIPLDVRTPSYSDACDAAQQNIAEMWNPDFWKAFIDGLARARYNLVSLWNLHPFPSMVRVPEYPEVALDDVQRSTVRWEENYSLSGGDFDHPEILENAETLLTMTIDQKIAFWREVMAYGRSRNVHFYIVTWNIFVNGTNGRYGIDTNINNPVTRDYFRRTIREMLLTYPDLTGIGLTTGENMPGATFQEKEDWAFEAYGQGVLDAVEASPGRRVTFIHRQHQTGARDIANRFAPLVDHPDITFLFSFKYAQAHVMSSTVQPFKDQFIEDIPPLKTLWTLRNDDDFHFRWGGAGFTREFLQNLPRKVTAGIYYGSDQYIWGREFLSLEPEAPRELEIEKHWYHWNLWGRLSYDPTLGDETFVNLIAERFPRVDAGVLFATWQNASMTYPLVTGFHWGALDFQWYIEGCQSQPGPARTPTGFHDVNRFISLPPHPGTDNVSIPDYVSARVAGLRPPGTTPPEVVAELHERSEAALAGAATIDAHGNRDLRRTLEDIRCMAYLGKYYAHKIAGATELALLRETLLPVHRDKVATELNRAAHYWRLYTSNAAALYRNPLWTNRVGYVDWRKNYLSVLYDLTIAGAEVAVPSIEPTPGGILLEAEDAVSNAGTGSDNPGFTGAGYLDFAGAEGTRQVTWSWEAPHSGTYILELRYAQRWGGSHMPAGLTVNGEPVDDLIMWLTGGPETWVWDRATVQLREGLNTITLTPPGAPLIDHLNIVDTGY
ncbi:MAG: carbohydrate-binding family 6 protein [Opitutaceae bacterium]